MRSAKKGRQWHFRMKAHIGVDAESGLVHTVIGTANNVNDVTQGHGLLHGDEEVVFAGAGSAGYQGAEKRKEPTGVRWQVAMRPGKRSALDKADVVDALVDKVEQLKASVRAKVEHALSVVKRQFGYVRVRQGALPGAGDEHCAADDLVCAEQSVDEEKEAFAGRSRMSASGVRADPGARPKKAPKRG